MEFKWQQEEIRLDIAKLILSANGEHLAATFQVNLFGQATHRSKPSDTQFSNESQSNPGFTISNTEFSLKLKINLQQHNKS